MKKPSKEWFIDAPWGKIALVSWGNPTAEPVLLVHGLADSVATFIPLLEMLPDDYYYVGLDFPGHGKSDPFPAGVKLWRHIFIAAVDVAVNHLAWKQFIFLGHSLGSEIGLFYHAARPHRVKKFIHLDPVPAFQAIQQQPLSELYSRHYDSYYTEYEKYNSDNKIYTKRRALDAVMNARGFSEEKAEIILSRNLIKVGEDQYKLSWTKQLHWPTPPNIPNDILLHMFTKDAPPTLFIRASISLSIKQYLQFEESTESLIEDMGKNIRHFDMIVVAGTHDLHVTNPERIANRITEFLKRDFGVKSKI